MRPARRPAGRAEAVARRPDGKEELERHEPPASRPEPIPRSRLLPPPPQLEKELEKRDYPREHPGKPPVQRWYHAHGLHYMADAGASPLIPLFTTKVLGGNVSHVGLVNAVTSAASVPGAIGWGELSDHLQRRKPFVLLAYLGTGIMFIVMGLSTTMEQFLGLNVVFGIIAAASVPVSTLIITEIMEQRRWSHEIGVFTRMGGLGWILGLLLGGLWLQLALIFLAPPEAMRYLFFVLGGVSLASGLVAAALIPEPPIKAFAPHKVDRLLVVQGRMIERVRYLPLRIYRWRYRKKGGVHRVHDSVETVPRPLRFYYLAVLLLFFGFQTVYTPMPIFLADVAGASGMEIFLFYLSSSIVAALMYSRAGDLIPRSGERLTLIKVNLVRAGLFACFGLLALAIVSGVALHHYLLLAVLLSLEGATGFFWAFVSVGSTTLVSKSAPAAAKGENMGLFNAMVSVGGILGALLGGGVAHAGGYPAAFFGGVVLVILGTLALALNRRLDSLAVPASREWKDLD